MFLKNICVQIIYNLIRIYNKILYEDKHVIYTTVVLKQLLLFQYCKTKWS